MKSTLIDPEIWQELTEIGHEEGNEGFLPKLILIILTAGKNQMENLLAAAQVGDVKKVRHHAHSLKSTCASVGAMTAASLFTQLEDECKPEGSGLKYQNVKAAQQIFVTLIADLQSEYDVLTANKAA